MQSWADLRIRYIRVFCICVFTYLTTMLIPSKKLVTCPLESAGHLFRSSQQSQGLLQTRWLSLFHRPWKREKHSEQRLLTTKKTFGIVSQDISTNLSLPWIMPKQRKKVGIKSTYPILAWPLALGYFQKGKVPIGYCNTAGEDLGDNGG